MNALKPANGISPRNKTVPGSSAARKNSPATPPAAHRESAPLAANNTALPQLPPPPAPPIVESAPTAPRGDEHPVQELPRPAEPPARTFAEYVVSADEGRGLGLADSRDDPLPHQPQSAGHEAVARGRRRDD
jgi:hypothetical protein